MNMAIGHVLQFSGGCIDKYDCASPVQGRLPVAPTMGKHLAEAAMKCNHESETTSIRPRVLRRKVRWVTKYMPEGGREQSWGGCHVLDLSRDGVGVELQGTRVEDIGSCRVAVRVQVRGALLHIRGDVRRLDAGMTGR